MVNITPLFQNLIPKTFIRKSSTLNFQSFIKFPEEIDPPDIGTVYGHPTSYTDKTNSSLHFNQSKPSKRNTRSKYVLQPQLRKKCLFLLFLSTLDKNHFNAIRIG